MRKFYIFLLSLTLCSCTGDLSATAECRAIENIAKNEILIEELTTWSKSVIKNNMVKESYSNHSSLGTEAFVGNSFEWDKLKLPEKSVVIKFIGDFDNYSRMEPSKVDAFTVGYYFGYYVLIKLNENKEFDLSSSTNNAVVKKFSSGVYSVCQRR